MEPDEILWMPSIVKEDLKRQGCKIPKKILDIYVSGAVIGQFAAPGQVDLAVLCVSDGDGRIIIYWGGNNVCPSELPSFGESLSVVGEHYIWKHYNAYGGNKPPKIDHEAINDHILGKASEVHYCRNGSWIKLTGAD